MKKKLLLEVFDSPESPQKIPIWFMRQAGRYLPEYRKIKAKAGGFLQMCTNPEIAAEVSLQPIRRFDLDAVIFFCDILTPLIPMGIKLDFVPQPVILNPLEKKEDIDKLKLQDPNQHLGYVRECLQIIRGNIPSEKTLIGFGGAPFTLASYLFKKKNAQDFSNIKRFCFSQTQDFFCLMQKLEDGCFDYLDYQVESGAEVIQIFDSWAGCFHLQDYQKFVFPFVKNLIGRLKKKHNTPIIYYLNSGSHLLEATLESGADVLSLDWRVDISLALAEIKKKQKKILLQGNLDPFYLFSDKETLKQEVVRIVKDFGEGNWIFNVGQGLDKETPIENVQFVIEQIRKARNL